MNEPIFNKTIFDVAKSNINNIISVSDDASFVAGGVNGPYFDIESPVRNTAHWCITYARLSERENDPEFKGLAHKLANFLIDFPFKEKEVYIHRQKHGKDWSNGVIGQGWVIEALAIAGRVLDRDDLTSHAMQAASKFPFDRKIGAWKRIDPRTGKAAIDYTLNHQLWYAAALSELNDEKHNEKIRQFLGALSKGVMRTGPEGRVLHLMYSKSPKALALRARYALTRVRNGEALKSKEVGYHLYNLHPLSRLKRCFPEQKVFESEVIKRALKYAESKEFLQNLDTNKYAYPYNSPAFEFPLVRHAFNLDVELDRFFNRQIEESYVDGENACGFLRHCPDPITLNARIYELFL